MHMSLDFTKSSTVKYSNKQIQTTAVMVNQFLSHSLSFFEVLFVELAAKRRVDLHHYRGVVLKTNKSNKSHVSHQHSSD